MGRIVDWLDGKDVHLPAPERRAVRAICSVLDAIWNKIKPQPVESFLTQYTTENLLGKGRK